MSADLYVGQTASSDIEPCLSLLEKPLLACTFCFLRADPMKVL